MGKAERLRPKIFLFLVASLLINFYVLSKLFHIFNLEKETFFAVLCAFLSISYFLGAALLRKFNNDFIKGISAIFSFWIGAAFIFLWTFGIYDIISFFFKITYAKAELLIFAADLIIISYSVYNATTFSVRTIRFESEKLKKSFKVIQLSDLHIGAAHKSNFLHKTVKRVNELNPDFVVITGDLIDGVHPYRGNEFECISQINAPVFFTLGNHEQFIEISSVNSLLQNKKMTFLRNESIVHEGIQIIGIDDYTNKKEFIDSLSSINIHNDKFSILLYHRPGVWKEAVKRDIDLMLSGHTHGGQIFPLNIIMGILDGPVRGLHRKNNTVLYVSNGTGWWGPPMRLGSRNEITIIELISLHKEPENENLEETSRKDVPLKNELSELLDDKKEKTEKEKHKEKEGKSPKIISRKENIILRKGKKIKAEIFKKEDKIKKKNKAKVISLKRGKSAFKESKKEDFILKQLNKK